MKIRKFFLTVLLLTFITSVNAQVGLWQLNNNATDASGKSYHGTIINGATFTTVSKEGSHALTINGTNQCIDLGNPSGLPSGNKTRSISAWAKTNITTASHVIASFGTATNGQSMFIGQNGTSLIGGAFGNNLTAANFWAVGVWHHICLTYNGTTAKLYADGVEVVSSPRAWNLVLSKAFIGRNVSNNDYWNGTIDDVRIYDTALTPAQVLALIKSPHFRLQI